MNTIEDLRKITSKGVLLLLWVNSCLIVARHMFATESHSTLVLIGAIGLAVLCTVTFMQDGTGPINRTTTGTALAAQIAILVYEFSGSTLQLDIHMYFFATLAICAAWVDWRPILSFTAITAVHHLLLFFVMTSAVFPTESTIIRVALHAIILLVEAGVLLGMVYLVNKLFETSQKANAEAAAAVAETHELSLKEQKSREQAQSLRDEQAKEREQQTLLLQQTITTVGEGLDRLSNGDLTETIDIPFEGEMDKLRVNFNETVQQMRDVLLSIRDKTGSIGLEANNLKEIANDLSKRTESQAASLQEAASAIEQISSTATQSSERAKGTNDLASETRNASSNSAVVVDQAIDAMHRIEDASKKITTIISVIDEIAFQTNLLALNAGVEAARAGDAGSGFAVVAQEVRDLAGRSAQAAKEIKNLINQSGVEVGTGVELVNKTGEAIKQITGKIDQMSENIELIAKASNEQTSSISEVNSTVADVDAATQQTAAMAEETNAALQELDGNARRLASIVSNFKLDGNQIKTLAA